MGNTFCSTHRVAEIDPCENDKLYPVAEICEPTKNSPLRAYRRTHRPAGTNRDPDGKRRTNDRRNDTHP
ncbi:hypothetical protein RSSM_03516 [Rhodopirellula sallentina SM41]|uniref:Uncharacterized protein n=1 Tax=Rhodopirellula sallentina SM41 TaxID=1263870 RepID=M5UGB1_9BACT|nr:hypothetical protein RSSM_03516 [Rhodopirellula sallentina SM41]